MKEVECLKNFQGEKGYDILLSKDNARKLIKDGFRPRKVFAKVVVGKKNYRERERDYEEGDRYERRDNRDNRGGNRRKYVEKDEGAKSEFTFQSTPYYIQRSRGGTRTTPSRGRRTGRGSRPTNTRTTRCTRGWVTSGTRRSPRR